MVRFHIWSTFGPHAVDFRAVAPVAGDLLSNLMRKGKSGNRDRIRSKKARADFNPYNNFAANSPRKF
jgi:hypothetical protein